MANGIAMLAIVCDRWDVKGGGAERYLADLLSYASTKGMKTRVYASQISGQEPSEQIRNISHVRWPGFSGDWQYCKGIERELATMSAKIVLAIRPFPRATHYQLHAGLYETAFEAERASLPSPIRRILYPVVNRLNLRRQRLLRMQHKLLMSPERPLIMVFSYFTALELRRRYHIPLEGIIILPHGVNLAKFSPPRVADRSGTGTKSEYKGEGKFPLLFVAHNFFLKGLPCLLEVLGKIRKSGVEIPLRVVGSGPRRYFQKLAVRYGIGPQVTFFGSMSQDHLAHLYRTSIALVHPTFYDPCSLVTLEALASGCPVVTTRRNGAAELFESGREGFILNDPVDTDALADALLTLRDPRIAKEMSKAASALAPSLDIKSHMRTVMEWLDAPRRPGAVRSGS